MTQIWGHRGASGAAPENTLAAFALARDQGAQGIELDVQLSADGALVIIHDETLDRTTTGHGAVAGATLAEIQALDASLSIGGYAGARVPTLAEVFDLLAPTDMIINVELKNSIVLYPGMEEAVLALVAEHGLADRVLLSTFNHYSLRRLQELGSPCKLGMLFGDLLYEPWDYAALLGVQAIHPPFQYLRIPDFVARSHERGLAVHPWTVNAEADILAVAAAGVDALITNYPARARQLLGQPAAGSDRAG